MPSFTYNDSEARKPFEEPGEYLCTIENFEWKRAQSSGAEMLVLQLRTSGGALVYDNLIFTEKSQWKIDHALKCFMPSKGKRPPAKGANFDMNNDWVEDNLKGGTGWVSLIKGVSTTGKNRNEVEAYLPPKASDKLPPVEKAAAKAEAPVAVRKAKTAPAPVADVDGGEEELDDAPF